MLLGRVSVVVCQEECKMCLTMNVLYVCIDSQVATGLERVEYNGKTLASVEGTV